MRDPARIDSALDYLREAWEANPDMRLGQLIVNAARRGSSGNWQDKAWWIEDADMMANLASMVGRPADPEVIPEEVTKHEPGSVAWYIEEMKKRGYSL